MYSITGFISYNVQPSDLIVASPPTEATVSDTDTEAAMTVTTTVATTAAATKPDAKRSNEKKKRAGDDDQVTPPVTNGTRVRKMEGTWIVCRGVSSCGCGLLWEGFNLLLTFHKAGNSEGVIIWLISTSKTPCG